MAAPYICPPLLSPIPASLPWRRTHVGRWRRFPFAPTREEYMGGVNCKASLCSSSMYSFRFPFGSFSPSFPFSLLSSSPSSVFSSPSLRTLPYLFYLSYFLLPRIRTPRSSSTLPPHPHRLHPNALPLFFFLDASELRRLNPTLSFFPASESMFLIFYTIPGSYFRRYGRETLTSWVIT